jgi:hypothetical protein
MAKKKASPQASHERCACQRLGLSLAPEELPAVTWLAPLAIALFGQFRGSWKVLTLKGCTAAFAFYRHDKSLA